MVFISHLGSGDSRTYFVGEPKDQGLVFRIMSLLPGHCWYRRSCNVESGPCFSKRSGITSPARDRHASFGSIRPVGCFSTGRGLLSGSLLPHALARCQSGLRGWPWTISAKLEISARSRRITWFPTTSAGTSVKCGLLARLPLARWVGSGHAMIFSATFPINRHSRGIEKVIDRHTNCVYPFAIVHSRGGA
jgi:hypothetical protein